MGVLRRGIVVVGLTAALVAALVVWTNRRGAAATAGAFVAFADDAAGCSIVVPAQPTDAELRAATRISETLAKAAGRTEFPVVRETGAVARRGIFVGQTRRGAGTLPVVHRQAPFDDVFALHVDAEAAVLGSARPGAIEIAAAWFMEEKIGAHWFMPGPLGESVPARRALVLTAGETRVRPGFVSRSLGVDDAWGKLNKLEARLEHGHSYDRIFTRADLKRNPQLAPLKNGARYQPADDSDIAWQPDLAAPAAVAHAAAFINREFDRSPARISFPLCENDSFRFDESPHTLAAISPLHFFRSRPDYTPLVFRFTNAVAREVGRAHPDRWVTAYAYYWCERAPDFPIEPNVVPFLTVDRSQRFEPAFADEDRATMAGWARSGARLVATYDYFEGAPYLVPRPTLYAVAAIPEVFASGIRAFYGEGSPNWGLDGPKAWLAAQLQWNPRQSPAALLAIYFREFWQEAAGPMRAFYEGAERAWLNQPRPGYWIKYYQDEQQAVLYPEARRIEMWRALAAADEVARRPLVRARVAFVRDAFKVTDAFVEFCAARDALARACMNPATEEAELDRRLREHETRRSEFVRLHGDLRQRQPLAIQTDNIGIYLRNDPAGAARLRLSQSAAGRALLAQAQKAVVEVGGSEMLADPRWEQETMRGVGGAIAFEWLGSPVVGAWRGHGEPSEGRQVRWGGEAAGGRSIRFAGCKTESLSQLRDGAVAGTTYVGRARVRARVSPGNMTFLIVTFFNEKFEAFAQGHTCRLPVGDQRDWSEISVVATAPAKARYIGFGLRVSNQVNDDYAEFAGASLRAATEKPSR